MRLDDPAPSPTTPRPHTKRRVVIPEKVVLLNRQCIDLRIVRVSMHRIQKDRVIRFVNDFIALHIKRPDATAVQQGDVGLLGISVPAGGHLRVPRALNDAHFRAVDRLNQRQRAVVRQRLKLIVQLHTHVNDKFIDQRQHRLNRLDHGIIELDGILDEGEA